MHLYFLLYTLCLYRNVRIIKTKCDSYFFLTFDKWNFYKSFQKYYFISKIISTRPRRWHFIKYALQGHWKGLITIITTLNPTLCEGMLNVPWIGIKCVWYVVLSIQKSYNLYNHKFEGKQKSSVCRFLVYVNGVDKVKAQNEVWHSSNNLH